MKEYKVKIDFYGSSYFSSEKKANEYAMKQIARGYGVQVFKFGVKLWERRA